MKTTKIKAALAVLSFLMLFSAPALAATDPCNNTTDSSGQVSQSKLQKCVVQTPFVHDINLIVNFLSIGVGVIVIVMILVGGVQYIAAGDNAQAVTSAKQHITNAFLALIIYIFLFAFLQWLIPGGLFSK